MSKKPSIGQPKVTDRRAIEFERIAPLLPGVVLGEFGAILGNAIGGALTAWLVDDAIVVGLISVAIGLYGGRRLLKWAESDLA